MFRRSVVVVVIGAATLLSACGSTSGDSAAGAGDANATVDTASADGKVGSIGDAIEVAAGAPAKAEAAACDIDRQTLESATEIYLALNGTLPQSQSALVDAKLVKELSPRFEITPEGVIVPAPGGPCV